MQGKSQVNVKSLSTCEFFVIEGAWYDKLVYGLPELMAPAPPADALRKLSSTTRERRVNGVRRQEFLDALTAPASPTFCASIANAPLLLQDRIARTAVLAREEQSCDLVWLDQGFAMIFEGSVSINQSEPSQLRPPVSCNHSCHVRRSSPRRSAAGQGGGEPLGSGHGAPASQDPGQGAEAAAEEAHAQDEALRQGRSAQPQLADQYPQTVEHGGRRPGGLRRARALPGRPGGCVRHLYDAHARVGLGIAATGALVSGQRFSAPGAAIRYVTRSKTTLLKCLWYATADAAEELREDPERREMLRDFTRQNANHVHVEAEANEDALLPLRQPAMIDACAALSAEVECHAHDAPRRVVQSADALNARVLGLHFGPAIAPQERSTSDIKMTRVLAQLPAVSREGLEFRLKLARHARLVFLDEGEVFLQEKRGEHLGVVLAGRLMTHVLRDARGILLGQRRGVPSHMAVGPLFQGDWFGDVIFDADLDLDFHSDVAPQRAAAESEESALGADAPPPPQVMRSRSAESDDIDLRDTKSVEREAEAARNDVTKHGVAPKLQALLSILASAPEQNSPLAPEDLEVLTGVLSDLSAETAAAPVERQPQKAKGRQEAESARHPSSDAPLQIFAAERRSILVVFAAEEVLRLRRLSKKHGQLKRVPQPPAERLSLPSRSVDADAQPTPIFLPQQTASVAADAAAENPPQLEPEEVLSRLSPPAFRNLVRGDAAVGEDRLCRASGVKLDATFLTAVDVLPGRRRDASVVSGTSSAQLGLLAEYLRAAQASRSARRLPTIPEAPEAAAVGARLEPTVLTSKFTGVVLGRRGVLVSDDGRTFRGQLLARQRSFRWWPLDDVQRAHVKQAELLARERQRRDEDTEPSSKTDISSISNVTGRSLSRAARADLRSSQTQTSRADVYARSARALLLHQPKPPPSAKLHVTTPFASAANYRQFCPKLVSNNVRRMQLFTSGGRDKWIKP
eukprot:scaffold3064_cov231-Pinguiococcus_pyrenoidosus.AAC.8